MKVASRSLGITTESCLWQFWVQLIQYLAIRDVADLEVLVHDHAFSKADSFVSHPSWHQWNAGLICLAYVAVDAFPAFLAIALLALPGLAIVVAIRQRPTQRLATVFSSKARWTYTSPAALGAVGELLAAEVLKVTVEAWRTVFGSLLVDGE